MHHRFTPARHRFTYKVFSSLLDLDQLAQLDQLRLFSVNRFNLFSFHESDHGQGKGSLAEQIRRLLHRSGFSEATATIRILCYPRILGYVFNPLSVYFCYDTEDQLKVVLYEVSNTFGSRHTYILPVEDDKGIVRQQCQKEMYVSPFMPMATEYHFRIQPPGDRVTVSIRQCEAKNDKNNENTSKTKAITPVLNAVFQGQKTPLCDRSLALMFVKYPLVTIKVIAGIHWEALRLWRKKLKIQPREKNVKHSISWQDRNGAMHYENL